jgi:predicted DNA-binding protein (MmcQ/YjbR family)
MDIIETRDYCLSLPFTEETTPFDETSLVMKVAGKMYALFDMGNFRWISLKCDPARAIELRERYPETIRPAWHFNKKHWNMVDTQGDLPERFIHELIDHSYESVAGGLPRALREQVMDAWRQFRVTTTTD